LERRDITPAERECDLSPESFARLAKFITGELGIKMPDSKQMMVQSRLLRRSRELGLSSVDDYGQYVLQSANAEERDRLINAITTNKTDFFREPAHFRFLTRVALPSLARGATPAGRLQVWSAGCSSGQEPYTLAMVLSEYRRDHPRFDYAILGTMSPPRCWSRRAAPSIRSRKCSPYHRNCAEDTSGGAATAPRRWCVSFPNCAAT